MALDLQLRVAFAQSIKDVEAASEAGGDPSHKLLLAQKGKKGLDVAFRLLRKARAQNNVPGEGDHFRSPELLVLAAETAVKNGEFDTAREACHEFFLDGGGARDQFYCRALFVKAQVVSKSIERDGLVGADATQRRSRAVSFLIQALDIAAEGGARYAFLVYNASVHAWNILRTALRTGRAGHHATELARFSDALEASEDSDLRWRCHLLTALSVALGDSGDAPAASSKATLALQHAEAFALRERETAETAREVLNEAKERVAAAQARIRKIEEARSGATEGGSEGDLESDGGRVAEGSVRTSSSTGTGKFPPLGTEEEVAVALSAALASRASAETDAVEAARKLTPLVKAATDATVLSERAWLFLTYSAAEGAAAGVADSKKLLESFQAQVSGDPHRGALLIQQKVTAGALTGEAILKALQPAADELDPDGVAILAGIYARAAAGVEEDVTAGGGNVSGDVGGVRLESEEGGLEAVLAKIPAPSPEDQSVLVNLGRTALRAAVSAEEEGGGLTLPNHRDSLLAFAKACYVRSSSSARKDKESGGAASVQDEIGRVSTASFRVRLEFLASELAAQGMLQDALPSTSVIGDGESQGSATKVDMATTSAIRLADRVEALKRVERALLNCKRLGDPELLQEGCCLAFSTGRALLSKHHRNHVHRCFSLAAQILEDLESPLVKLRTQLHFEIARCEVDSDFLAKAASHVEKAHSLDYGTSDAKTLPPATPLDGEWDDQPGEPFSEGNGGENGLPRIGGDVDRGGSREEERVGGGGWEGEEEEGMAGTAAARAEALNDALRPLDRFMIPLASFLRLKTSVDLEPSTAEDKALLLIDQGKQALDPTLRRNLLARAAELLDVAMLGELESGSARKETEAASASGGTNERQNKQRTPTPLAVAGQERGEDARSIDGEGEEATGEEEEVEIIAAKFASQLADGSGDGDALEAPRPSSKRLVRLWFTLLELAWDQPSESRQLQPRKSSGGGKEKDTKSISSPRSSADEDRRDVGLARKAAVAVLQSGPWSPEKNRELVVMQARAQFILGETYVEELRLAIVDDVEAESDAGTGVNIGVDGIRIPLDPRTMGVETSACGGEWSADVAELLNMLKCRACGCFVGGMRRSVRAREPALVESGAVYVYNYHMPVWRKRLHHLATPDLRAALAASVEALEALDHPDTALLCSVYEALTRTLAAPSTDKGSDSAEAEKVCLLAITALDRPTADQQGQNSGGGGKGGGGAKGGGKKGDRASGEKGSGSAVGGADGARRATVTELKGLVEVRARCQATRGGAPAITGEGRPLLQALALLTGVQVLSGSGSPADNLVERCISIMREYRGMIAAAAKAASDAIEEKRERAAARMTGKDRSNSSAVAAEGVGGDGTSKMNTTAQTGKRAEAARHDAGGASMEPKIDVFATLSARKGTTLEEDQGELELAGEIWCRLGKELLVRGTKRQAEECCGYVAELLPHATADRRKVHSRLWRWLAVAEGLWGQVIASMVAPENQEKPLQDELRRVSMKHLAMAAKYGTLASSAPLAVDIAKRLWNVALPLADTVAGRATIFSSLRTVLREMAKGGIIDGGSIRAQLYVLLFECYSDRSEWKQGLDAVTDSLRCVPPDFQRPLWQWRVIFLSRLGRTALDGLAKTKESDKVLQGKSWCTLARSAIDPKQQLSAYVKALESLDERFERVDCLVEMGEWATGKGLVRCGADYLRSALDLLYDVEENAIQASLEERQKEGQDVAIPDGNKDGSLSRREGTFSHASSASGGVRRVASQRSLNGGQARGGSKDSSRGGSKGSSRGGRTSQGAPSSSVEPDENGYPETLSMGHLETAVRILAMLARGGDCSTFEERLDLLLQAYYFLGRMATTVVETIAVGCRHRLYEETVPEGPERSKISFEEWCNTSDENEGASGDTHPRWFAGNAPSNLREWAYWRPEAELGDDLYRYMASPPPGRAPFVLETNSIDKAPLLFHHLLDLAETMESHGLAAHAAAPLAICELVARLCLGPPGAFPEGGDAVKGSDSPVVEDPKATGGGGKGVAPAAAAVAGQSGKGGGGSGGEGTAGGGGQRNGYPAANMMFPALALACIRRLRLLIKLGPTCRQAALQMASATGRLGVSIEEAAQRGAEVDRILRQREESQLEEETSPRNRRASKEGRSTVAGNSTNAPPPSTESALNTRGGGDSTATLSGGQGIARVARAAMEVTRVGKPKDRKIWALLAREAVQLGECQAAAEYLTAAQRHNDAFNDRDNVISCLETQAALCDAQGHPERGLPCLLRASALLRAPGAVDANAARWGKVTIAVGDLMLKVGMGDAKVRQSLQTACDALEGSIFRSLDTTEMEEGTVIETGRRGGTPKRQHRQTPQTPPTRSRVAMVDLDAAVAFLGCTSLLAEASIGAPGSPSSPSIGTTEELCITMPTKSSTATSLTAASSAVAKRKLIPSTRTPQHQQRHQKEGQQQQSSLPPAIRLLSAAADKLRPLGNHPAFAAILRRTAREWARRWLESSAVIGASTRLPDQASSDHTLPYGLGREEHLRPASVSPSRSASAIACLENAAACLAEARGILSVLVTAAEPTGDVVASSPPVVAQKKETPKEKDEGATENDAKPAKGKGGAKGKKSAAAGGGAAGDKGKKGTLSPSESSTDTPEPSRPTHVAAISTPLGRSLAMVQLEEASVRMMLARVKGEARSSKKAKEAAANEEWVTPVDRYMEASRPLGHPTLADMELPQLDRALALAISASERCRLSCPSYSTCPSSYTPSSSERDGKGDKAPGGQTATVGFLPLALAWEGSALALLAARAGLCDEAWLPQPPPPRPPTPPPQKEPTTTKGGKGAAGGGKAGGKAVKGGKGGDAPISVEKPPAAPIPPMQEGFDLFEQAKWKLERATEVAVASKRWDAAGVSSFALAEMVGGDDAVLAAGALMLHQSCRARGRMLRLIRGALPQSSRYRIFMDRVTAAQGMLRGTHNLDTCDPFLAPSPFEPTASTGGAGGEGAVANINEFWSAQSSCESLSSHLEGWRRLDCDEEPALKSSLSELPQGLGVLSLQTSPDGTMLYAAGYAPVPPPANETTGIDAGRNGASAGAVVWRHEMKPRNMRALAKLQSCMEAFQGSVKRHCLESCDEEGKKGDYNPSRNASEAEFSTVTIGSNPSGNSQSISATNSTNAKDNSKSELNTAVSAGTTSAPTASSATSGSRYAPPAECEIELDGIISAMESVLSPVWAEDVDGGLAPFLDRCRAEEISLVLLLDESLEKLPVESCAALAGIPSVSRDFSLHMLRHRLKATAESSPGQNIVSNANMRYVADPLSEDPGIDPPPPDPTKPPASPGASARSGGASPKKKGRGGGGKKKVDPEGAKGSQEEAEEGGRRSILRVLRECVGQGKGSGGSGASAGAGKGKGSGTGGIVKVSAWKGIGGDEHVAGVREWQLLLGGSESNGSKSAADAASGGFVYYGPGRCLSKFPPKHLAGLSVNCKAAILVDRADNNGSRRLESKQDTLKSQEEVDAEGPAQTAALFSLAGCQSVVLNMWSVTLHNNRRIICSLFNSWGDEGLPLGGALATVRGDLAIKPRSRFCTVLYGLPTLKYGP